MRSTTWRPRPHSATAHLTSISICHYPTLQSKPSKGIISDTSDRVTMPQHPPSIRDLARHTGYGKSTIAAALANSPKVIAATRDTILKAAKRFGYRHDPLIAALAARRWRTRPGASPQTLAYVYDYTGTSLTIRTNPYLPSARAAADRNGYQLEPFDLALHPSHARASRALWTRGYRGLLIGRIMRQDAPIEIEWERFTAVACALGLTRPPVHVVEEDYFEAARRACDAAIQRGYRRPGYVHCVNSASEHDDPERIGGFLFARRRLQPDSQIPVCICRFREPSVCRPWLRKWRPDVVIGFNDTVYWSIRDAGLRIPQDVGYVSLSCDQNIRQNTTGHACMDAAVGTAAVELLVGQIHLNARGIPKPVQTILVEPEWIEGATLPGRTIETAS